MLVSYIQGFFRVLSSIAFQKVFIFPWEMAAGFSRALSAEKVGVEKFNFLLFQLFLSGNIAAQTIPLLEKD